MLRLGECQRHADKEKGKKTLLEAKALLENRAQGDDEADDVRIFSCIIDGPHRTL